MLVRNRLTCYRIRHDNPRVDALETIRSKLSRVTWRNLQRIADEAGVPFHTLRKIVSGETQNPSYRTVEKLLYFAKTRKRV